MTQNIFLRVYYRLTWPIRRRWRGFRAWLKYVAMCRRGEAEFCFPKLSDRIVKLGLGDGEWTVSRNALAEKPLVYSFGVGDDISFDLGMIEKFDATVHAFDPTPIAMNWLKSQTLPDEFHFHPLGISSFDGTENFALPGSHTVSFCAVDEDSEDSIACPVALWETIISQQSLTKVDVLKLDIEGAEYDIIDDFAHSSIPIKQLLIEFHHRHSDEGFKKTKDAIEKLKVTGFRICYVSTRGLEYSFVKD